MNKIKILFRTKKKRFILLLEVLIACVIVIFCATTLLSPQVTMALQQQQTIRDNSLNNWLNNYYAKNILENLYQNEISWENLISSVPTHINNEALQSLGFEGTYKFTIEHHKPTKRETHENYYLFNLDFYFLDIFQKKEKPRTLHFQYKIFAKLEKKALDPISKAGK